MAPYSSSSSKDMYGLGGERAHNNAASSSAPVGERVTKEARFIDWNSTHSPPSAAQTPDAAPPSGAAAPSAASAQARPSGSSARPAASTLNASEVIRSALDNIEFQGLREDWWAVLDLPRYERDPDRIRTAYAERRAMLSMYHTDFAAHHPPLTHRIEEGIKIVDKAGRKLQQFAFYFDQFHRTSSLVGQE